MPVITNQLINREDTSCTACLSCNSCSTSFSSSYRRHRAAEEYTDVQQRNIRGCDLDRALNGISRCKERV